MPRNRITAATAVVAATAKTKRQARSRACLQPRGVGASHEHNVALQAAHTGSTFGSCFQREVTNATFHAHARIIGWMASSRARECRPNRPNSISPRGSRWCRLMVVIIQGVRRVMATWQRAKR